MMAQSQRWKDKETQFPVMVSTEMMRRGCDHMLEHHLKLGPQEPWIRSRVVDSETVKGFEPV